MPRLDLRRITAKIGIPPLVVIRRPLDTGASVLEIGSAYPVDWSDKRQAMRARQYSDQRRVAIDTDWAARNIPGAAKRIKPAVQEKEKKRGSSKNQKG